MIYSKNSKIKNHNLAFKKEETKQKLRRQRNIVGGEICFPRDTMRIWSTFFDTNKSDVALSRASSGNTSAEVQPLRSASHLASTPGQAILTDIVLAIGFTEMVWLSNLPGGWFLALSFYFASFKNKDLFPDDLVRPCKSDPLFVHPFLFRMS